MNQCDMVNRNCEDNKHIMDAVESIITEIGDDPKREGLRRTPKRFSRACGEWFAGYRIKPEEILNRTFPNEGYDDLVIIKNIDFTSFCEHHLALFPGKAHIGIVYKDRITGLDKFIKLVDAFARRLQTQEVMTRQIGEAIVKVLDPKGVIIIIEGRHSCVWSRETKNYGAEFITTYRYGLFKEEKCQHLESKFLQMVK